MLSLNKLRMIILFGLLFLFLTSCNNEDNKKVAVTPIKSEDEWEDATESIEELDGVWVETEYETYITGTLNVCVKWFNIIDDEVMYGNHYVLEKKVNNNWKQVNKETDINYVFNDIGYILEPNKSRWHNFNLIRYTDGLTPGEYRINTTFSRMYLNGVDYGPGNYPDYQVYGYFSIDNESKERAITNLIDDSIEYKNNQYGFAVNLPKEWDGFQVIEEVQNSESALHEVFRGLDEKYSILRIRHPKWTADIPYQDIVFVIVRTEEWNKNANSVTHGDLDKLPKVVLSNREFLLTIDPDYYNMEMKGYPNVLKVLLDSIQQY